MKWKYMYPDWYFNPSSQNHLPERSGENIKVQRSLNWINCGVYEVKNSTNNRALNEKHEQKYPDHTEA